MTYIQTFDGRRGSGKTTKLVKLAAKEWYYIVCKDRRRVVQVTRLARDLTLDIPQPITFSELTRGEFFGKNIKGLVIDDIDDCLQELCREVPLRAWSFSTGDHIHESNPK